MVGQGYDGAAVSSGRRSGVHIHARMCTRSAHAMFVHCSCHRLQLAGIQAAESVPEMKKIFGLMGIYLEVFLLFSKESQALKDVQAAIRVPELRVVKRSDTHWLLHECYMQAIQKGLPAIITTFQQLCETSGDAEAFGLGALLAGFTGVTSVFFPF